MNAIRGFEWGWLLVLAFILLMIETESYSQTDEPYCTFGMDGGQLAPLSKFGTGTAISGIQQINKKCLVILVKATGDPDPWNPLNFDNGHSMNDYLSSQYTSSFRNYFADMSHGEHIVSSRVDGQADITKWYTITATASTHPWVIVDRAIQAVDNDPNRGFSWSEFDGNGDDIVDLVMVIPGGTLQERGSTVREGLAYTTTQNQSGYQIRDVPITRGKSIWGFLVGNMAHEYGHALGLPELYDRSGLFSPNDPAPEHSAGVGNYCVMGGDYWNPGLMCGWARSVLGWVDIIDITANTSGYTFFAIQASRNSTNRDKIYRLMIDSTPGQQEYFLIENRQPLTVWEEHAEANGGLFIWHIDDSNTTWPDRVHYELHKGVDLECADGLFDGVGYPGGTENTLSGRDNLDFYARPLPDPNYSSAHNGNLGDATDGFYPGWRTAFTPETNPNTNGYNGNSASVDTFQNVFTHIAVTNIIKQGSDFKADLNLNWWSTSATATAFNGGRKLARDSNGYYHLVYESSEEIFYQSTSDDGGTWRNRRRLSGGNGNNLYPCIAERGGKVYVVWQKLNGSTYDVYFHKSTDGDKKFAWHYPHAMSILTQRRRNVV